MTSERNGWSRGDVGVVQIVTEPNGLRTVTVLQGRDDPKNHEDVICVHLRCKRIVADPTVRFSSGSGVITTLQKVGVIQNYTSKTVYLSDVSPSNSGS